MRRSVLALAAGSLLVLGGCFALFPLDDYGPGEVTATEAGAGTTGDGAARDAGPPARLVFVTRASYGIGSAAAADGGFEGAAAASTRCAEAAARAGLPGTFRAWIASGSTTPATTFSGQDAGGPLVLRDGTRIADDYADLFDAGPRAPIRVTEDGSTLTTSTADGCGGSDYVWTGATSATSSSDDCRAWRAPLPPYVGRVGIVAPPGGDARTWTDGCRQTCDRTAHLYCFQQ